MVGIGANYSYDFGSNSNTKCILKTTNYTYNVLICSVTIHSLKSSMIFEFTFGEGALSTDS